MTLTKRCRVRGWATPRSEFNEQRGSSLGICIKNPKKGVDSGRLNCKALLKAVDRVGDSQDSIGCVLDMEVVVKHLMSPLA
jgi:hypothetical protein